MGQMSVILVSSVVRNISDLRSKDQEYTWMKILSLHVVKIDRYSGLFSTFLLFLVLNPGSVQCRIQILEVPRIRCGLPVR